jgi:nucleoside-diphosphate-sugar epimerase
LRGKITAYLRFPVTWVAGGDVASGSIAALDKGEAGARYWLTGRAEDELSTAEGCNVACKIAGVEHRVVDLDHRKASPAELEMFGPTLYAIAEAAAGHKRTSRSDVDSPTHAALGYEPVTITEGMTRFVDWLRAIGKL